MASLATQYQPEDCLNCKYRSLRMFCNLEEGALRHFDTIGTQVMVPRGSVLFREDDACRVVHVICKGQVKLSCSSSEGRTLILKVAMSGDVLGLGAAISGLHYEVTAEALEPTTLKSMRREEFMRFLKEHGEASMHAARALSDDYKSAFVDARRLALSPTAASKLAGVLLGLGRAASCGRSELRFAMALTHEELASLAGTTRETVTRTLSTFQKEGLIQIRGASMLILKPERLNALAV